MFGKYTMPAVVIFGISLLLPDMIVTNFGSILLEVEMMCHKYFCTTVKPFLLVGVLILCLSLEGQSSEKINNFFNKFSYKFPCQGMI